MAGLRVDPDAAEARPSQAGALNPTLARIGFNLNQITASLAPGPFDAGPFDAGPDAAAPSSDADAAAPTPNIAEPWQPGRVIGLGFDNAVKIVAGEQHMCALTADDEVLCWGTGTAVGNGSARPVRVPLPRAAIDVGAGSFTSCALLDDGSTYCWGSYAPLAASTTPALITFP